MRPPDTLSAFVVVAAFRRRWAALARRLLPTPLTCTRRKTRRSPPRAVGTDGPASTCSCVAEPKFFVGADASTVVSASTFVAALPAVHGTPTQAPFRHVSPSVHALPSSHGSLLGLCTQPCTGSQPSVVHTLPSSHGRGGPPMQIPPAQVSAIVQASPSSHGAVFGVWTQPCARSQLSVVHGFLSSQSRGTPTQTPPVQVSPDVQTSSPSSHGKLFAVNTQPRAASQLSV